MSPRPRRPLGAPRSPWLEVDAEAVWWRSGDAGAERVALVALDAQGLPGDVALFTQRIRAALGERLRCDGGSVALEVRVTPAARLGSVSHAQAQMPTCVDPSLELTGSPRRPRLHLSRVGGQAMLGVYRVARGWRVGMEGQFFAPGCHEAQDGGETVESSAGDGSEALRACVRAAATAPSLRPWFSVQNRFIVAAPVDATMGEVCAAASAFAEGMEPVARATLVTLAVTSSAADPSTASPPRPLTPPFHVPAHDRRLDVLRDTLSACAADGGALEVAGSIVADAGRFVAARPIAGSPGARACAERALGEVTLAPPQGDRASNAPRCQHPRPEPSRAVLSPEGVDTCWMTRSVTVVTDSNGIPAGGRRP